jgi:seryl-tRNA synthetase
MKYHFDIQSVRDNPEAFVAGMARRGFDPQLAKIQEYDVHRRNALANGQTQQALLKTRSAEIGQAIKAGDNQRVAELKESVAIIKDNIKMWSDQVANCESTLEAFMLACPNRPAGDVPDGTNEHGNVEVKWWNADTLAMKTRGARDGVAHWDMDLDWGWDTAAKISGSRFSMLGGGLAKLHRALGQFMLDTHSDYKFKEIIPPSIVNEQALYNTGQLPKFAGDLFGIAGEDDDGYSQSTQYLIPTAEVPLTNILADQVIMGMHRYVALTDCFRSEAGSAGRDTRGLIRQHQFQKVELVTICEPQQSIAEHEYMTLAAERILELLKLPYRRMLLCTGDMGFSAQKTFDLEVWLPGQNAYREISSVSNCGDFQARRANIRYKVDGKTVYAHTLNGSGVAVGRALVAVVENYQLGDGDVMIPQVLQMYMGGRTRLSEFNY